MICRAGLVVEMGMGGEGLVQSYEQGNAGQQNAERHQKMAVGEDAFALAMKDMVSFGSKNWNGANAIGCGEGVSILVAVYSKENQRPQGLKPAQFALTMYGLKPVPFMSESIVDSEDLAQCGEGVHFE